MNGFGVFSLLAAGLQLTVPSYALRLVRRFGSQRVGWFLVLAFSSLASLYLVGPAHANGTMSGARTTRDLIFVAASSLLLIGMGHLETLCSARQQAEREEHRRLHEWEAQIQQQTADLAQTNQQLSQELARREQKEKLLIETQAQYRFLFFENPHPMWIIDLHSCRFLEVNHAALRHYGFNREEFMALTPLDLLPSDAAEAFLHDLAKPAFVAASNTFALHRKKDSTLIDVEISTRDLKYADRPARLVLVNDITARRRGEQMALEAQKTEVIGQIAGGVAHHFNNLLTVIAGHASLLLGQPQDADASDQLKQISAAATRAAGLTRQLLAASSRLSIQLQPIDLNGLIRKLSPMLRRLCGDTNVFQVACTAELTPILADAHTVEVVLVNLVLNARDAMLRGGTLAINTTQIEISAQQAQAHQGVKPGPFLRLDVRDTGCGMTPSVQVRIFEPFFTTRDIGKGTGLGLASVHGAVKQHGGWIEFTSQIAVGTEFRVFFPCAPVEQAESARTAFKQTILLVEPEERARSVARHFLSRSGYHVIEVDSAATALVIWESQAAQVDLVLAGLQLPGEISGRDLADQLRQTRPDLKVAFLSETETEASKQQAAQLDGASLISKPFNPSLLLEAVESCLSTNT